MLLRIDVRRASVCASTDGQTVNVALGTRWMDDSSVQHDEEQIDDDD
jgi:hypothetical protein